MSRLFLWGETVAGFDYPVINERDARSSAGIMFLLGLVSLFSVFTLRTLFWAELFSLTFVVEFIARAVFNPKYAPYMLLGGIIVQNQAPEWVEARPKRFAWSMGLFLGAIMAYYIVFDVVGPVRIAICLVCLLLLFLESAFGICLGCILYRRLHVRLQKCPGGVCAARPPQRFGIRHWLTLIVFFFVFSAIYVGLEKAKYGNEKQVIILDE